MNNIKIIEPEIFKKFPEIKLGFSTAKGGEADSDFRFNLSFRVGDDAERVKRNRNKFFGAMGISEKDVSFQKQTHSTKSNYVSKPEFFHDSDALYTDVKNNFLALSLADCIPVFLYEPVHKVIAAIHSGWRGTQGRITTLTAEKTIKEFSLDVKNIFAYIGPGISGKNFEVGKDISDLFEERVKIRIDGKFFIDLKKHNFLQLVELGVPEENIEISGYCTYDEKDLFHSYRRDKEKSGRMLGVIGLV
jgi:polyphenol oxidase